MLDARCWGQGALVVALTTVAPSAWAWGFEEHDLLGVLAYRRVCSELRDTNRFAWTRSEEERLDLACGSHEKCDALLGDDVDILVKPDRTQLTRQASTIFTNQAEAAALNARCHGLATLSLQYGQFNALGGDHLDPDNMQGTGSQISAKNLVEYVLRGVHDADHFHPQAPRIWRSFHNRALARAVDAARSTNYLERIEAFWEAFYLGAYADHFLEDAFSSGHSGFNRPGSTPSEAFQFHRDRNQIGAIFRDAVGRLWVGYGDSRLRSPENRGSTARVMAAVTGSVRDLLVSFVTARRWPELEQDVAARLPVESRAICFGSTPAGAQSEHWQSESNEIDKDLLIRWQAHWRARLEERLKMPAAEEIGAAAANPHQEEPSLDDVDRLRESLATIREEKPSNKSFVWELAAAGCENRPWTSLTAVRSPAHYNYTHDVGVNFFGRLAPVALLGGFNYRFAGSGPGLRFGIEVGPAWTLTGNYPWGLDMSVAPMVALPLGGRYGTVLSWDLDVKAVTFVPLWNRGPEYDLHVAGIIGGGMTAEFGFGAFRFFAGPALAGTWHLGPGHGPWTGAALGWQASISYERYVGTGGGIVMTEAPL